MPDALFLAAALLSSLCGMGWLALAMKSHWRQVRGDAPLGGVAARVLRALGAAALGLSLLLCLRSDHVSMAVLVWVMALAASALTVAFTLSWRPHWLRALAAAPLGLRRAGILADPCRECAGRAAASPAAPKASG